ncbi:Lnb N-terminal periplasmic domain-containing protein [Luteimonas sp. MHLX1A]|uniref:Lnb N-terminal periplasmic domain-containing protein n=1 Tax=Alterluteimonas muca TaxID=2878684 RepID=UPI001E3D2F14|nr:DUF4105 domain-containing protein [Luteimonas sp. MHLX1A]MCD9047313.1 DUF4105 domain-containing protein [Luteimonas sp. MHLX1A]
MGPADRRTVAARMWRALRGLLVLIVAAWGALALWFQLPGPWPLRALVITGWCALGVLAIVRPQRPGRRMPGVAFAVAFVVMLGWWSTLAPSHDRDWADDVARLLEARVDGDRLTLHNVRNFEWRSETDYTTRWETRSYDLDRLESADLILSYWMGPHIAHTLVSFGFEDGEQLVFSLEIRKERHEGFSAIGGFFRKFEQVIIAADERDIVRTRSNARGEDVYLYRLRMAPEAVRALLLGYIDSSAELRHAPRFYNTLTSNCTTIIYRLARHIAPTLPVDYRLLLSGHFAEYAYDHGGLTPGHDYAGLQARGHINARALASDAAADDPSAFSRAIRRGVPGIAQEHEKDDE